jgi:hypothetical protein
MSSSSIEALEVLVRETEQERVERWRLEALVKVGYDSTSAAQLAVRNDVDLHRAIGLVERGCPPEIAVRILI